MSSHQYLHFDVFTRRPLAGNQLAVFPHASELDADVMQRVALEMAFPETTFVLPRQDPTIGSTFALAREGFIGPDRDAVVFELGVGPTPVSLEWTGDELAFAWMTQPLPEFGQVVDAPTAVAATLGLDPARLRADLPVQVVSCGIPVLFAPLVTRAAVDAVRFALAPIQPVFEQHGLDVLPVFVFSLEPGHDDATVYSRMFAPAFGIPEDPATGGASGPLGAYLLRHGAVSAQAAHQMVSLQGVAMGRPSRVHISIASEGGSITSVRVGGAAVLVAEGTLRLPQPH